MGQISKGILGGFSGKVGTVIGGSWKGIEYMRSKPGRRKGHGSQKQLEHQAKFALSIKFVQSLADLFQVSYRNNAVRMSGVNSAHAYTLKNCITGSYPNFKLNYSMVLMSRGDLPNASNPVVSLGTTGVVNFNWANNAGTGRSLNSDKAILVIYEPTGNTAVYTTGSATRDTEEDAINAAIFIGKEVQTYIGFISDDGKEIAQSIYTGPLTIQ